MTVQALADALGAEVLSGSEETLAAEVKGGYCGDLLSWVMGRAPEGGAWITIMQNPNVAAVAQLACVSCVILAEGVRPDAALQSRMDMEDIPMLRSEEASFSLSGKIYAMINE